jgi:sugar lactone lactonase YvrE
LLNIFKCLSPVLALFIFGCSSGIRNEPQAEIAISPKPILSLRLLNSVGPGLGESGIISDPSGLAVNDLGEIFFTDKAEKSIYKLSADLTPIWREGSVGGSTGGFSRPSGISSDAALNIYVADEGSRQIQIFDRNLRFVRSISNYFDENDDPIDFSIPSDIVIDREGNFWISDDDKVIKLDSFFKLLYEASDRRSAGYFILGQVSCLSISRKGIVAIGDEGNRRVVMLSIYGNYFGQFSCGTPIALAWDDDSNIWVAESSGKIEVFNLSGDRCYSFSGDESGSKLSGVASAGKGRLVILDSGMRKVKLFEIIRGSAGER